MDVLRANSATIYAITRIVVGFLFTIHGVEKMFGVISLDEPVALLSLRGVAGVIELVAGALICLGLKTSWAAFISSGQMAVAYFYAHQPQAFWFRENGGELSILYCFIFLYFAAKGSGILSIDHTMKQNAGSDNVPT